MADPKHLPYDPSVISKEEYEKYRQRFEAMLDAKNAAALPAAERMSKRPWSSEQAREQVEMMRANRLAEEAKLRDRERGNRK